MILKVKILLCAFIILLFLSASSFSGNIRYFSADGTEISAREYEKEAKVYEKKYLKEKVHWSYGKYSPRIFENNIHRCIELSGMNQFIDAFPGYIDAQIAQRKITSKNPELDEKVAMLIKDSFDSSLANQNLYEHLKKNMNQKLLRNVLHWLETPLARKVTKAENEASSAEAQAELLRYLADLQTNSLPSERIALIQNMVKKGKFVEHNVNLAISVMEGMLHSFYVALPEDKKPPKKEIDKIISQMKPVLEKVMRQQTILSSLYTYRNISNDELEQYIKFLTSKNGVEFYDIAIKAVSYTLNQTFIDIDEKIIASLERAE